MGTIRKMVLNLVLSYKNRTGDTSGIPTLRLCAGWDNATAFGILKLTLLFILVHIDINVLYRWCQKIKFLLLKNYLMLFYSIDIQER
jgi:hypothetical protein